MENKQKVQRSWAFYDWANSVYSLVISTAVFPIYYNAVTSSGGDHTVHFLGRDWINSALYSYTLSVSFLLVSFMSPILSGIADASGRKKDFMYFFCLLGSAACAGLYFFDGSNLGYGLTMSLLASLGFWGSLVFYNAFLPEIAAPEEQDNLSARGFSMGYLGSSILLILCLAMISLPDTFGFESAGSATRFSFLMVGGWWFGFAQFTFRRLPSNPYRRKIKRGYFLDGYKELYSTWKQFGHEPLLKRFLLSFFFYSMGVQTVILLAGLFGDQELGLESSKLIMTILLIQFVAIAGSILFSRLSARLGNLQALRIAIFIWMLVCGGAYVLNKHNPHVEYHFYALAGVVGLVMGGIQSLSRSTYSKLLPETVSHASYFSFYDVAEKLAIVIGTVSYGYLIALTGNMRSSALAMAVFFLIGLLAMTGMKRSRYVH